MIKYMIEYLWPSDNTEHAKIIQRWWKKNEEYRKRKNASIIIQRWWRMEMWWHNKSNKPIKNINKKNNIKIFKKNEFVMNLLNN